MREELSPLAFLRRAAAVHPDRPGAVDGDRIVTYGELGRRAGRLAAALRGAGLEPGEPAVALMLNRLELLEAHFGIPGAGGMICALNTRLAPSEVGAIVEHSRARILLLDPALAAQAAAVPDGVRVIELGDPYEAFLAQADGPGLEWPGDEEAPIALNYTSGTTGNPKGVVYTHRGAFLNATGAALETGLGVDSVYLWTLPMFHCNGWCHPWAVTAVGARHILQHRFEPGEAWRLLHEHRVTHLCGAPTVLIALAAHPDAAPVDWPVTITTGGAPPSPTILARYDELGIRVIHMFGLTETYGPSTLCVWPGEWDAEPAEDRARRKARQGVPHATGGEVRVVDDAMADVPRDGATMGEVVMRGNTVMAGYLHNREATDAAFAGGWFHSGDAAVVHPDGYIEVRDRFKDVIISGGENISTIEVEQALARHPAVLEAAVVGVPHDYWGERPKAYVVLANGASVDAADLIGFVREQIAHYKAPDEIEFVTDLPKTATGKVKKHELRAGTSPVPRPSAAD
jgi:fatty-acyl-CoA synthase